jgi:hypothetical protein
MMSFVRRPLNISKVFAHFKRIAGGTAIPPSAKSPRVDLAALVKEEQVHGWRLVGLPHDHRDDHDVGVTFVEAELERRLDAHHEIR